FVFRRGRCVGLPYYYFYLWAYLLCPVIIAFVMPKVINPFKSISYI
ncbi:MAG: hypothetical protein ACI9K8_001623, partial [Reinekea sp.]